MAEENGVSEHDDTISVSTTHLGKRKRTVSPDTSGSPAKANDSPLQTSLQEVLRILRKHDFAPSLLKYPLSSSAEAHDIKRARLTKTDSPNETIEGRILAGTYSSFRALMEDLNNVKDAILKDLPEPDTNGDARPPSPSKPDIQERLSGILKLISVLDAEVTRDSQAATANDEREDSTKASLPGYRPRHILSLRSQVNGSTHLLYSGLEAGQPIEGDDDATPEDARVNLPNGFELTDFAALGGDGKKQSQEKRLLGTVFRPSGRLKPMDLPRPSKNIVRGNTLDFVPLFSQIENNTQFKHDYRFAKLPTGSWVSYGDSGITGEQNRKRSRQLSTANDFKAALEANDIQQRNQISVDALYSSVYSSFAPGIDNSTSMFSEKDRSRQWFRKYGEQKLSRIFRVHESEAAVEETASQEEHLDSLEEVVANFEPEEEEISFSAQNEPEDVDGLLQQVSDLIQTLSSYQKNRSLEPIAAGSVPKPSEPEIDIFEILRMQLNILVSALPPFAVAKLNGDQLEALNISTRVLVDPPDYPGTGQVDDYTFRRQKMSQQATSAASRTTTTPHVRPSYGQAAAGVYNSQVRSYNSAVPATAPYGMRAPYQTPTVARPSYPQTSYQTPSNPYPSRPTIQQFQRPVQNGYGNYGSTPGQAQPPGYVPRPGQPGYQQRPQDSAVANVPRSASPQKPIVNGQLYQSRQYPTQQTQSPYPYQRQASGTPGTPAGVASVGAGYGRYDGSAAQPRAGGGTLAPPVAPAQAQAQTVEVSR